MINFKRIDLNHFFTFSLTKTAVFGLLSGSVMWYGNLAIGVFASLISFITFVLAF